MKGEHETYASFFRSHYDMVNALFIVVDVLRDFSNDDENAHKALKCYRDGLCRIDEVCNYIKEKNENLSYVDRDHIIELFFKDRERRILIVDKDYVQYRKVSYVQPPDYLYFGTVKNLVDRMTTYGIKSRTKGFVKLYSTPEQARGFAEQFATREGDIIVTLKVNAKAAFSTGTKFSTHKEGEYIAVRIDKRYILDVIETDNKELNYESST